MNNQGLEALAALASAAPSTSNRGSGAATGKRNAGGDGSKSKGTSNGDGNSVQDGQSTSQSSYNGDSLSAPQMAQWQQLMTTLANSGGGGGSNMMASNPNLSFLSSLQQQQLSSAPSAQDNNSFMMGMQNMAYYQLMGQSQAANQQNQMSALSNLASQLSRANQNGSSGLGKSLQNPLASFLQASGNQQQQLQQPHKLKNQNQLSHSTSTEHSVNTGSKPKLSSPSTMRASIPPIAPQPPALSHDKYRGDSDDGFSDGGPGNNKREQKRAANRRSAQLSRKRKKQFIEELKEENDELRRKEQILKSLPDLVVVFDSSGRLGFVSHSVDRLLSFTAAELEGTSFWERLCEDSVRLLKAAFMDSLATREAGSDTAPLGTGVWELRLVDKDNSQKLVALNGVVHFAGDRPECVCSIRPREKNKSKSSSSNDSNSKKQLPTVSIDSRQSAIGGPDRASAAKKAKVGKSRGLVRVSDSGSGTLESGDSESGSSDE